MARMRMLSAVFFFTAVAASAQPALFDCRNPAQRLPCAAPDDANKRFICHATGSAKNPYVRIAVPRDAPAHRPGVPDDPNSLPDQEPGASANDVGSGSGLDCDCKPRVCVDVCTGAALGTPCDDGDACTGNGTCAGNPCVPGPPICIAGVPADACNVQTGLCDPVTGICFTMPVAAGTPCGDGRVCNGTGTCVECLAANTCPGVDTVCSWRTCVLGTCGRSFALAGTPCGVGFACDGSGSCAGIPHVVINEVESSGGVPGDWVELFNDGTAAADVSGWKFLDNDNSHTPYVIPLGTVIPVGGYLVLEESQFVFGLGSADSARLFDANGTLVDSYTWTTHALTTYGRCPNGSGPFQNTTSVTKGAANDCSIAVRINEIESSGGVPGDWVELFNAGPIPVDMSGWIFRDNDDTHAYVIAPGTILPAGAYYLLEEAAFGFGLGAADAARIFDSLGNLIDSYSWTAHATTTYGRCPNGSGAFATTASATKGAANACGTVTPPAQPWPGTNAVHTVDAATDPGNLSDLFDEPASGTSPNVLWAIRNAPSVLYRLVWNGSIWTPETVNGWDNGKVLHYPNGSGSPDAEGVTRAELASPAVYVSTERDNDAGSVSRLSVLRFDTSNPGIELTATHEWNLTLDLPAVGSNLGLEALTWIPDTFLVARSFFDESAGHLYTPSQYADHGTGLFFVGLEANGMIYAYALDHVTGGFHRIATIGSGSAVIKGLAFDRETGYLWVQCGAACANQSTVLVIDTTAASPTLGRFKILRQFSKPTTMDNLQNEGVAMAPESQCAGGFKPFFWTDDGATGGHALRADTIPCGQFIP
jgi:hypothetical protein